MSAAESVLDRTAAPAHPRPVPLIPTKLGAPLLPLSYRARARLDNRLDRALDETARVALVSAPPGYGKSVAVAGWLAARAVPHAWLSLDAGDNDPARFLRYLAAAIAIIRPGMDAAVEGLPGPGLAAGVELVGATLVDVIAASDDPFVLVLDDYHVVTAGVVHGLVQFLVAHGPPFAHLVIVTREDPPLPLARLRAHGRLVELRADELRYTDDEAHRHLAEIGGVDLEAGDVARLVHRTEGWIAGVQLAAISLHGRVDARARIDAFAGTQRYILDYLAAEVLADLDADLRAFLVRISVAGRFSVALCRELSGRDDSAALLAQAERRNLFVIPLDLERTWYRFHHLFADYLRTLLDDAEERALHERAANWFEDAGLTGEAIDHALAAGSTDRAIGLVEEVARATYEEGELTTLLRWFDALPADRVAASPELIAMRACSAFNIGRIRDAARACAEGEAARPGATASGPLLTVTALIAAFANRTDAVGLGRAAVKAVADDRFFHGRALQALAAAQLNALDLSSAGETARIALDLDASSGRSTLVASGATALITSLNMTGHRREAEALCRQTLANHRAEASRMAGGTPYLLYWLGIVLYEANDLTEAIDALERAWAAAGTFGFGRALFTGAVSYLALARQATGSPEAALDAVRTVLRDARAAGLEEIEPVLAEIEARLCVLRGDVGVAARWADAVVGGDPVAGRSAGEPRDSRWSDLQRDLTVARIRFGQKNPREARRLLHAARRVASSAGDAADLITIRVLEAAIAETSGDRAEAQRALEDAIRLAAPDRYVRRLVDDGRPVAHLLPAVRRVAPAFVDEVMAALTGSSPTEPARVHRAGTSVWRDEDGLLVEALTARELEVLQLMARGSSDATIASALVVSLATAKWHAAHIRGKLGARSRTQAILRAQELGLV